MKKIISVLALTTAMSFSAMATEISGYVIDKSCAAKPAMRGDVDCAVKCIKGGSPAVLVTEEGKIYKIDDQAKVVEHAGYKVTISGTLDGDTVVKVDSVKR